MKKWRILLAFCCAAVAATAQEPKPELETATVTATQSKQLQRETGRNITIIKGSLFQNLPINSVDELLRYAPGVEVHQRGPQGSQSDILIRGGTFQQVLVLIDGIRLNDPLTGHFNGNIPVHPNEIDRIEVLKGSASATYGSEAVGGVIHIITKAFALNAQKTNSRNAKIGLQLGQYGLRNLNAYYAQQQNNRYFSLGAFSNNADGPTLKGTTNYFNLTTLNTAYGALLKDGWRISAKAALDFRKFNAQNFYTTFISDTANEKVNSQWAHVGVQRNNGHKVFTADVAYKYLTDEFQFNPLSNPNQNKSRQITAQLNYQSKLTENADFVTGFQVFNKRLRSNDRGNHGLWHTGSWFTIKHRFGKNVFMNEGLRFDWDENYGAQLIPQLNLSYVPSHWSFRFSAGRGIRDADFTERYNNYQRSLVRSGSIGNPDLQTEQTWNLEAGFDYLKQPSFKLSGTFFYRSQKNLIDFVTTPYAQMPRKVNLIPTGTYALAKNIDDVKTYGFETDMVYQKQISEKQSFMGTLGFTVLRSKNDDSVPSFYISSHAKLLTNFNLVYKHSNFSVSLNGLYKERNTRSAPAINATITKNYFLLNARADAYFYKGKISVFAQAHNLFDREYSDLLGARMPGRWLSGGISMAL
jgi:vitamin B12 transporter